MSVTHSQFQWLTDIRTLKFQWLTNASVPSTIIEFHRTEFQHSELQFHNFSSITTIEFHRIKFQGLTDIRTLKFQWLINASVPFQHYSSSTELQLHNLQFQNSSSTELQFHIFSSRIRVPQNFNSTSLVPEFEFHIIWVPHLQFQNSSSTELQFHIFSSRIRVPQNFSSTSSVPEFEFHRTWVPHLQFQNSSSTELQFHIFSSRIRVPQNLSFTSSVPEFEFHRTWVPHLQFQNSSSTELEFHIFSSRIRVPQNLSSTSSVPEFEFHRTSVPHLQFQNSSSTELQFHIFSYIFNIRVPQEVSSILRTQFHSIQLHWQKSWNSSSKLAIYQIKIYGTKFHHLNLNCQIFRAGLPNQILPGDSPEIRCESVADLAEFFSSLQETTWRLTQSESKFHGTLKHSQIQKSTCDRQTPVSQFVKISSS